MRPNLQVLSKQDIELIHEGALKVLERTGAKFLDERMRKILSENGCEVDESTFIVKFPRSLVEDCLGKCPKGFTIAGRDRKNTTKVGTGMPSQFSNFGTAVKFGTYENGKYVTNEATVDYLGQAAKMVDALDNFTMAVTPMSAVDLVGTGVSKDTHEQFEIIKNLTKHSMADWVAVDLHYGFDMEVALCGGDEEEALKNPIYTIGCPPASPLIFDDRFTNNVIESTKYHMPSMAMGMVLNGATGPISIAGSLVVAVAESLATIVCVQCCRPGNPTWFGSSGTIMDMKSGGPAVGSPERALISAAIANIADYYGLPSFIAGPETDSKIIDVQSGHEKTITGILSVLANASMHFGPGMLENGLTFSPEQLLIDNDIISMMKYTGNGIEVTEPLLYVDDIDAVGPGGDFLAMPATMEGMANQSAPALFDRIDVDAWMEERGGKDAAEWAHQTYLDIIQNHTVEPIDNDIMKDLEAIVKRADSECKR